MKDTRSTYKPNAQAAKWIIAILEAHTELKGVSDAINHALEMEVRRQQYAAIAREIFCTAQDLDAAIGDLMRVAEIAAGLTLTPYHVVYTRAGEVKTATRHALNVAAVESWLADIGATWWEIGTADLTQEER